MRIVHLGTAGPGPAQPTGSGGTEKFIYFITRYLAEWDYDVSVIDIKSDIHKRLTTGAKFYEVWVTPLANKGIPRHLIRVAFFCTAAIWLLRRLQKEKKVDIIHTHNQFPAAAVMLAKKLWRWKVPVVHSVHNPTLLLKGFEYKWGNWLENAAIKRADYVTTDTEYVRQELITRMGIDASRTSQVYSGMDMDSIISSIQAGPGRNAERRDKTVLCVARIHPGKNQMAILKAADGILRVHPEARFIFAGPVRDQSYMNSLREFTGTNGLSDHAEFTGEITQDALYGLYKAATVFVFPTLNETQGLAVIEAMAFGLPVIASRIGPIEDVVNLEEGSAILVNPDNTGEIADAVNRLLGDESLRQELSRRGQKLASRGFSWEQIAREMIKIYQKVVSL